MIRRSLVSACVLAAVCGPAVAFINPNFTPVHLSRQSDAILVLRFSPANADGVATAKVEKALKGTIKRKEISFDFGAGAFVAKGKKIARMISAPHAWGLLFVGMFDTGLDMSESDDSGAIGKALLHVGKDWVTLTSYKPGAWEMDDIDARLLGTWAGSTEMLRRAVLYSLNNEDADVPVKSNAHWAGKVALGKVPGHISAVTAVDIDGDGRPYIFIASDKGDQLIRYLSTNGPPKGPPNSPPNGPPKASPTAAPKTPAGGPAAENISADRGLASASLRSAWCDLDRNGKIDLASWSAQGLRLFLQQADGSFVVKTVAGVDELKAGCLSLSPIDCGRAGPGLLAATPDAVVLILFDNRLNVTTRKLPAAGDASRGLGKAGECLLADFDDDGLPDVCRLFEAGGLLYRGTALGRFARPVRVDAAFGQGRHGSTLGDYDMDGLLDILTCAEDGVRIWHNAGEGKFVEMLAESGEIEYISKRGGVAGITGDINNNGRQDITLLYGDTAPQVFFNRGFNSFGHARMLDVVSNNALADAANGQQAGCLADVNGDGALDLVVALTDGGIWMLPRKVNAGQKALAAVPVLTVAAPGGVTASDSGAASAASAASAGKPGAVAVANAATRPAHRYTGPLTVIGQQSGRCLGAYSISAGQVGIIFGLREPGPVNLHWKMPDGTKRSEDVFIEQGPVRVILNSSK